MGSEYDLDVLVVGGGSFGTALSKLLTERGNRMRLLVRRKEQAEEINETHVNSKYLPEFTLPENLVATSDLEGSIERAPVVLMVVPSRYFRDIARKVGDYIRGDQILVHATKGLEPKTYMRMSDVLREETCSLKIGVISGPNLAVEIMRGDPAGAVVASNYREVRDTVHSLFEGGRMRMYTGKDVIGTEIGGAFKNIIALAAGMSDGLGMGNNTKALLMTRGLGEMIQYGVALGADMLTFGGLAGIGDLMATCASPLSRNNQVGRALAKGKKLESILRKMTQVAEGVPTSGAVHRQARKMGLDLPIVKAVNDVISEGLKVPDAVGQLMSIPVGDELSSIKYG